MLSTKEKNTKSIYLVLFVNSMLAYDTRLRTTIRWRSAFKRIPMSDNVQLTTSILGRGGFRGAFTGDSVLGDLHWSLSIFESVCRF